TEERSLDAQATHNATGSLTLNPSHVVLRWTRGRPIDVWAIDSGGTLGAVGKGARRRRLSQT
ncbi:hypothetical protein, partial [Paraburkholderia xenovorans]|uniref:hypothetical protein n=1 Tax=Paraburkholderia xenovorans TaxID=36873 RepID=UPI0038B71626